MAFKNMSDGRPTRGSAIIRYTPERAHPRLFQSDCIILIASGNFLGQRSFIRF